MFKKQLLMLSASLLISMTAFSQKKELKVAAKALKKSNYETVLSTLATVEGIIDAAPGKLQSKYYYLQGKALYAEGTKAKNTDAAMSSFLKVVEIEKDGSKVYTNDVAAIVSTILEKTNKNASDLFQKARENSDIEGFNNAANEFYKVYKYSSRDTIALFSSAYLLYFAKKHELSNERLQQLIDLGFTGISTNYKATSKVTGEDKFYASEKDMNNEVKLKIAENPETIISKSKMNEMVKYIALNYVSLGDNENALKAIAKAREAAPDDYDLIINEANIYYKMGDNAKFVEKLEEAISLNPTDAELHYNVGTLSMDANNDEKAKKHLLKAIELNPEYANAYNNLANLILKKLKPVEEEMNANSSNFAKYDQIKAEKYLPILKESLPFLEKAYEFKKSDFTKNQLNSLYENLEMEKRAE